MPLAEWQRISLFKVAQGGWNKYTIFINICQINSGLMVIYHGRIRIKSPTKQTQDLDVKFPSIFVAAQLCQNFGRETNKTKQAGIGPTNQRMTCQLLGKLPLNWKLEVNSWRYKMLEKKSKTRDGTSYPPGNQHIPPWEKENHLQNAIFWGYVSSLEGNHLRYSPSCKGKLF